MPGKAHVKQGLLLLLLLILLLLLVTCVPHEHRIILLEFVYAHRSAKHQVYRFPKSFETPYLQNKNIGAIDLNFRECR